MSNPVRKTRPQVGRFRYFFADVWWRALWFWGSIVWCAALNVLILTRTADGNWVGPLSVVPLFAFVADMLRRDHALRAANKER